MGLITAYAKLYVLPVFILLGILYTIGLTDVSSTEKTKAPKFKFILLNSLTNIFAPCSRTNFDKVNYFKPHRQILTVLLVIAYGFFYPAISFLMLIIFPDTYTGDPPIFSHRLYFSPIEIIIALSLLILGPLSFMTMICMELYLDQVKNFDVQRSFSELPENIKEKVRKIHSYKKMDQKIKEETGLDILTWSAKNGQIGLLKSAFKFGLRKRHISSNILLAASQNGHLNVVKMFLTIYNHVETSGK